MTYHQKHNHITHEANHPLKDGINYIWERTKLWWDPHILARKAWFKDEHMNSISARLCKYQMVCCLILSHVGPS